MDNEIGNIDNLIQIILSACEDNNIRESLVLLLLQPEKRVERVQNLVVYLDSSGAPVELVEAIKCLKDDNIAQKTYDYINKC